MGKTQASPCVSADTAEEVVPGRAGASARLLLQHAPLCERRASAVLVSGILSHVSADQQRPGFFHGQGMIAVIISLCG